MALNGRQPISVEDSFDVEFQSRLHEWEVRHTQGSVDPFVWNGYQLLLAVHLTKDPRHHPFCFHSVSSENAQSKLKDRVPILETELENAKSRTEGLPRSIHKAKMIPRPAALTPKLVHEFIEKIVVSVPECQNGKRYQKAEIHCSSVGIFREPAAEELEKCFQKAHPQKHLS